MRRTWKVIGCGVVGILGAFVGAVVVVTLVLAHQTGKTGNVLQGLLYTVVVLGVPTAWVVTLIRRRRRRAMSTPTSLHVWGE